jgi:small subunit ribosomal protein S21
VATIVTANEGESFDSVLKRFNRKVQQDGILSEARRRGHYQKPITRRARKAMASRRQATKAARAARRQR